MTQNNSTWFRRLMAASVITLICSATAFSQLPGTTPNFGSAVDNLIPPSPEAAALGKYATIPVGLYTGTPQINIPVWQLTEGDISLPISFSYHASGNKADEIAPRTGMGWTLNAGGVVTRTVIKRPDELSLGFLQYSSNRTYASVLSGTEQEKYDTWVNLSDCYDAEPDQFYFSFAGYTGSFAFDWNHNIVVGSDREVKVEPIGLNIGSGSYIQGWKVTGDDGTVYTFEAKESSDVTTEGINPCTYGINNEPVTSWYLTSIVSPGGNAVYFAYQPYKMVYDMLLSQTLSYHLPHVADKTQKTTYGRMTVKGLYLTQITTRSGNTTINFINSSEARTDVPSELGSSPLYSLGEIIVLNKQGQERWHVKQTYDPSPGRLMLKSIQELPVDGSTTRVKPPYEFAYYSTMPGLGSSVGSYAQDHWGYFNGNDKGTLIPPYYIPGADGTPQYVEGANRSPNGSGALTGILTRIKYPTGGTTTFDYEANRYSFVYQMPVMGYDTIRRSVSVKHVGSEAAAETTIPFTVGKVLDPRGVEFFTQMGYCSVDGGFGSPVLGPHAIILDAEGHSFADWNYADDNYGYIKLPPGNYFLKATARSTTCANGGHDYAYIQLNLTESDGPVEKRQNKIGGGIRIKKITDYDGLNVANNIVRKYEYTMPENDSLVSSGVMAHEPRYEYTTLVQDPNYGAVTYNVHVSNSVFALGFTQSSPVGYRKVNVLYGENGEFGKSESYFTSFYDANDDYTHNEEPPYPPTIKYDYMRGLLQKQIDYKWENGQYKPVRQIENTYEPQHSTVPGLKVEKRCPSCTGWNAAYTIAEAYFNLGPHAFAFGIEKLKTSKETLFDSTGSFTTEMKYEYDPALHFLQKESTTTSDGKEIVTTYSYPFNYTSTTYALDLMNSQHILSPVIEKLVTQKAADGTEKVIDASFTQYTVMAGGKVLPLQGLALATDIPGSITRSVNNGGNFDEQKYSSNVFYEKYSSFGKPEQFTTRGGMVNSYIWGYSGTQLMARVTNAPVDVCAFTSFEDWDYEAGNWQVAASSAQFSNSDAHTGTRSVSGSIFSVKTLPAGKYVLSYWAKAPADGASITVNGMTKAIGRNWARYEWILTNPGTINIETNGNLIDDLRLHPVGAQMKTFTYDPAVGVTSVTDENHTTLYYEYDNYNRLKNIKDTDGNILKNYQYNYKN